MMVSRVPVAPPRRWSARAVGVRGRPADAQLPPEKWPADPDDLAIGAYMDGDRYAWIVASSRTPADVEPDEIGDAPG